MMKDSSLQQCRQRRPLPIKIKYIRIVLLKRSTGLDLESQRLTKLRVGRLRRNQATISA